MVQFTEQFKYTKMEVRLMMNLDYVMALAFRACRETGGYKKYAEYDFEKDQEAHPATKTVLRRMVSELEEPGANDKRTATKMIDFYRSLFTMRTLRGKISDFDKGLSQVLAEDQVDVSRGFPFGKYAFMADMYLRDIKKQRVLDSVDASEWMGKLNVRQDISFKVASCVYSRNYGIYFITAVCEGNMIRFAYKDSLKSGKVYTGKGTVKEHISDSDHQKVTKFNRVVLKKKK